MNNDQEPEERQGVSSFRIADILASSPTHSSSRSGGSAVGLPTQTSPCNLSFGVERILAAQGIFGVTSARQDFYYKLHPGYWNPAYTCYTLPGHGCEACSGQSVQLPYISTKLHETFSQYQRYSQSTAEQQPTESLANQSKPRKPRRPWTRAVFSNLQRKGLEKRFQVQKYLTKADRHQLAAMLGLSDNQVKVWFQNRRMKWRQEARESVSSTNPEGE